MLRRAVRDLVGRDLRACRIGGLVGAAVFVAACALVAHVDTDAYGPKPDMSAAGGSTMSGNGAGGTGTSSSATTAPTASSGSGGATSCLSTDVCVDAPPEGWSGPDAVYVGSAGAPPCGGGWADGPATVGTGTLTAPDATCTACSCAAPTYSAVCGAALFFYPDPDCNGFASMTQQVGSACSNFGPFLAASVGFNTLVPPGTCEPSGGTPTLPPASYSEEVHVCLPATPGGTCAGGVCAAPVASPYRRCIHLAGDNPCPSGSEYTDKTLTYGSFNDGRGCSQCACGAAAGGKCYALQLTVYGANSCMTPLGSVDNNMLCDSFATSLYVSSAVTNGAPATGGSCMPSGAAPNGTVTPQDPMTICCVAP